MKNLLITKTIIKIEEGIIELHTDSDDYLIRLSFEAVEQFYKRIEIFLAQRRKFGLIEGESMRQEENAA